MNSRIKQILAYILMITVIMGNTVNASAAGAGSVSFNGYEKNSAVETLSEEKKEDVRVQDIKTEEDGGEAFAEGSLTEDTTAETPEAESRTETTSAEAEEAETEAAEEDTAEDTTEATAEEDTAEEDTTEATTEEDTAEEDTTEATTEEDTAEDTTEAITEEDTAENTTEAITEEGTAETATEATTEESTTEEDTTEGTIEESSEMLSLEALNALAADSEETENVYLYSSDEKDGEFVQEGIFASLQDALDAIEILEKEECFYRIEMVNTQEDVVTSGQKTLDMPRQTAGIVITGGPDLAETSIYFKGTLKLESDVVFEDIIFVPTEKTAFALGTYELTLDGCRVDDQNDGMISGVSGSGTKEMSGLILKDTNLHVNGAVDNVGTVVFAEDGSSQSGIESVPLTACSLTADGRINIGNVELEADGYLTGTATVTRKKGMITKITPQITIVGEVYATQDNVLYLDLLEKKDGTYQRLDLDKEEATDALKK